MSSLEDRRRYLPRPEPERSAPEGRSAAEHFVDRFVDVFLLCAAVALWMAAIFGLVGYSILLHFFG